jgi:hypothetical protein
MLRLVLMATLLLSGDASAGVLANIAGELQNLSPGLIYLIRFFGFVMIVAAIVTAPHLFRTGGGMAGTGLLIGSLIVGSLLINLSFWIRALEFSAYGYSNASQAEDILSGVPTFDSGPQEFVFFALVIIMLVGIVGVVRGTWLLRGGKSGQGRSIGHAVTLLIGGTLAINFLELIKLAAASVGGTYSDQFQDFFGPFL